MTHSEWEGDWLYAVVGEMRLPLADVEVWDGGAVAHIHNWIPAGQAKGASGTTLEVHCRSRAEAISATLGLLALRHVNCAGPHPDEQ